MRGWFDAFRTDGGPTLYSFTNRTPVTEDAQSILIYVIFITLFVAFLIIFPGIRKERFTTFISVTLSLFVGAAILLCNYGSGWHVSQAKIAAPYRAFSREKIVAHIGVYIGLNSVNITLRALPESNLSGDIDFNERFCWNEATDFKEGYREALEKGLPFPILTVAEYLSLEEEGFCWGGRYRTAGYYSYILLWTCFAVWVLMNILFAVVPRYGAYTMVLTGLLQLLTNVIYYAHLPNPPLIVPFEGGALRFRLGWCFWLTLVTGFLCTIVGLVIAVIDLVYPHKFSTVLEVDYDTPYDRHIILKDKSQLNNNRQRQLQQQKGGRSIEDLAATATRDPAGSSIDAKFSAALAEAKENRINKRRKERPEGLDNAAFEDDRPKRSTSPTSKETPSSSSSSSPAVASASLWRNNSISPEQRAKAVSVNREHVADVNIDVQTSAAMW